MKCGMDNEKELILGCQNRYYISLKQIREGNIQNKLPFRCEMLNLGELALKFPPKATEDKEKQEMQYLRLLRSFYLKRIFRRLQSVK